LHGQAFTDEEWNLTKYPGMGLYQNNTKPTISDYDEYKGFTVKRINVVNQKFYANGSEPGDVRQGACVKLGLLLWRHE
jgi:hypothetical protein